MRLPLLFAGLLLIQGSAFAGERSLSRVDAFVAHSKFKVDDVTGSSEDMGYGARLWVGRSWPLVTAEYTHSEFDGDLGTGEAESLRGGLGLRLVENQFMSAWVRAEYLTLDLDLNGGAVLDDEGLGLHTGALGRIGNFSGFVEVGGVRNTDSRGPQFSFGGAYEPANWGLFMEYRQTRLELEKFLGEPNISLTEVRGGVRWLF